MVVLQGKQTNTLFILTMFNTFRTNSSAINAMSADLLRGKVIVRFETGHIYSYLNVSRRAIANLLSQPNMSLGFWVNNNCVNAKRVTCV